ncbi:hypothetical protein CDD82_5125 [Ophiocordyceps australis]|uniref:Uncharacterized protein n=1 Tax=Ophiocordyceps australis TaxID=1399860 RepID=A0A2C5XIW9_9HYPO|nr:hypothetical protein CDD82_5125 [Ophiocordyceps australis]
MQNASLQALSGHDSLSNGGRHQCNAGRCTSGADNRRQDLHTMDAGAAASQAPGAGANCMSHCQGSLSGLTVRAHRQGSTAASGPGPKVADCWHVPRRILQTPCTDAMTHL